MRLQTDQEFQQKKVKKLNSKFNVKIISSRIRGEKALAAEQKIREFKKLLFKKNISFKVLQVKDLIQKK